MRWTSRGQNTDVEDRRGEVVGGRRMIGGPKLGIGGILLLLVLSFVFKRDLFQLLGMGSDVGQPLPGQTSSTTHTTSPEEDKLVEFVSFVLDDVQDTWTREFEAAGERYERAKLVLFTDAVRSGCGFAEAAMGPFYCPADEKVYIDLGFYRRAALSASARPATSRRPTSSPTRSATTCRTSLGIYEQVRDAAAGATPDAANELSVRLELQADCLAGVWAHSTDQRDILERGDVEEGLGAAAAVGDDRIQKQADRRGQPRDVDARLVGAAREWFQARLRVRRLAACDTFAGLGR